MPVYRIEGPDKKIYRVEAGDEQTALSGLQWTLGQKMATLKKDAQKFNSAARAPRSQAASDAYSLGLNRFLAPAVAAADTGVRNMVTRAKGGMPQYSAGEMFNAVRDAEGEVAQKFQSEHPVQAFASGLLGGLAMPGGKQLARLATPKTTGLLGGIEAAVRGAGLGAGLGGAVGATTARSGEELKGAARGAITGAVTGGAVPIAAGTAGAASGAVGRAARTVARATNKASGGQLLNPQREAGLRLVEALKQDKIDPATIRAAQNEWLKNGVSPTLLDLVSVNGGGQNTRALLRGAAVSGSGRDVASRYNNQVVADLQDNAIGLTGRLTPGEARSAQQLSKELDMERSATADRLYPAFKGDQVAVSDLGDALTGDAGASALSAARRIADTRRDYAAVAEIDGLISGQSENVSAGTLDLIRRGLRDAGEAATRNADRTLASGLAGRSGDIEAALTNVPGFDAARRAFRSTSQQIDAIDTGLTGLNARPDAFAEAVSDLPANAVAPAQVGYRQALTDAIGNPTEGATGVLNRIGSSTNQGRNLSALFGDDMAGAYRGGMQNLTEQVQNARFINPNTGSATAGRALDAQLVSDAPPVPRSAWAFMADIINKIRAGATLTDEERALLVQMGVTDASGDILSALSQQERQAIAPRLAPALAIEGARER